MKKIGIGVLGLTLIVTIIACQRMGRTPDRGIDIRHDCEQELETVRELRAQVERLYKAQSQTTQTDQPSHSKDEVRPGHPPVSATTNETILKQDQSSDQKQVSLVGGADRVSKLIDGQRIVQIDFEKYPSCRPPENSDRIMFVTSKDRQTPFARMEIRVDAGREKVSVLARAKASGTDMNGQAVSLPDQYLEGSVDTLIQKKVWVIYCPPE